jgi:hypothetical protein
MKRSYFRREFLKKISSIAGLYLLVPFISKSGNAISQTKGEQNGNGLPIRINPAFRINHKECGSVELYTFLKPGQKISYTFTGLNASVLILLAENKQVDSSLQELASKYSLDYTGCEEQIKLAIKDFDKKGLIYYGDLMLVKKTEEIHE